MDFSYEPFVWGMLCKDLLPWKNTYQKSTYTYVHKSTIYNLQKLKVTQMSNTEWVAKTNVALHDGLQLSY